MKRSALAAALSTCCLALSGCGDKARIATHLPTPAERLVCVAAGPRPTIPPEYQIDWPKVDSVAAARKEHDRYVASIRTREGIVAAYVVSIEGKLFLCSSNAQWRRDYEAGLRG